MKKTFTATLTTHNAVHTYHNIGIISDQFFNLCLCDVLLSKPIQWDTATLVESDGSTITITRSEALSVKKYYEDVYGITTV